MAGLYGAPVLGVVLVVLGVRTLNGWQAQGYRRPRAAGWGAVLGGIGLGGAALLALTGLLDGMPVLFAAPAVLMLTAVVLVAYSRPLTRSSQRGKR